MMPITEVMRGSKTGLCYGSTVDQKTCYECDETKAADQFTKNRRLCKACLSARNRDDYAAGVNAARSYEGVYARSIQRLYGMTMDDYDRMLRAQAYRCKVCRRPETKLRKNGEPYRLCVDHDHVTKRPRGLLCHRCNVIVWALEENHTLVPAIFAYVEQFRESLAA